MMTKEQHEKLKKYEQMFRNAIDAQYVRAMDSHFAADFIQVCKELCIHINPSCPACVLRAAQTLGKLYFDFTEPEQEVHIKLPKKPVVTRNNKPKKTKTK